MKLKFASRPSVVSHRVAITCISEPVVWISFTFYFLVALNHTLVQFFYFLKHFPIFHALFSLTWDHMGPKLSNPTPPSMY